MFRVGTSVMRWAVRSSIERGLDATLHVASFAFLGAAGAVATMGGQQAVLMGIAGLSLGYGSGLVLSRDGFSWTLLAYVPAVLIAPLLLSFAEPSRLARVFFSLGPASLVAALAVFRPHAHPRPRPALVRPLLWAAPP